MKRNGQLLPTIATWPDMAEAFRKAALGKRVSADFQTFEEKCDLRLNRLIGQLATGEWWPGAYTRFQVRDPKLRWIHAAPFADRIVHHAIMNVVGPLFERSASPRSYACRKGLGNRAAVHQATRWTRSGQFYLKLDLRKYFDSIDHAVLKALFQRRFKDASLLQLLGRIIDSYHTRPGRGLPIGTLCSQYFANHYLDGLDRLIVENLGCRRYVRYMDDFVLWHENPAVLVACRERISSWLANERGLKLKVEAAPCDCREGLLFLGYRLLDERIYLGSAARRRFRKRLLECERAYCGGVLTAEGRQRRIDALLAFTEVAQCRSWRRKLLAQFDAHSETEGVG
jgi:retron-type reverse transcriptase